jgi:ABC-type branched-subunit amino acid transport system ATPase component/ABC-type branched-subunit amino acid transport system permease subunit
VTRNRTVLASIALACLVLVAAASGSFYSFRVAQFCIFALLYLSLVVLTGTSGVISLLTATFLGVGAFTAAAMHAKLSLPFLLSIPVAGMITALACVVIGLPVLRLRASAFIVMTLGFASLIDEVVFTNEWCCGGGTRGVAAPRPALFESDVAYLVLCAVCLAAIYAFTAAWRSSRVGRALVATRDNPRAAEVLGVNVVKARLAAFAISGFIAGVAGSLFAGLLEQVSSQSGVFGIDRGIEFFGLAMLGGITSLAGPIIAGTIRVLLGIWLDGWEHFPLLLLFLAGPGTVLVYLRAPDGIAGLARRVLTRRTERAEHAAVELDLDLDPGTAPIVGAARAAAWDGWPGGARLRCREVTVSFGGLRALDDVDLTVEPGQIVGLLGTNGAGKSTLINVVSGLVPVTHGRVAIDDPQDGDARPTDLLPLHPYERAQHGVGRTFQDVRMFPSMSCRDNLLVAAHTKMRTGLLANGLLLPRARAEEAEVVAHVERVLELVDLGPFRDARADELSYGTLRMLELAAMLVLRPKLLLLDEPASGVAEAEARALRPLLRRIRDETGVSIVLVEHDVGLVADVADRIVGMDAGRVLCEGAPQDVLSDPAMIEAYLGLGSSEGRYAGSSL